jgi:hypothetical protein
MTVRFSSLFYSFRFVFDVLVAAYTYEGVDDSLKTYSLLTDFNTFFLNVVYANYLIAVLTTIY